MHPEDLVAGCIPGAAAALGMLADTPEDEAEKGHHKQVEERHMQVEERHMQVEEHHMLVEERHMQTEERHMQAEERHMQERSVEVVHRKQMCRAQEHRSHSIEGGLECSLLSLSRSKFRSIESLSNYFESSLNA